MRYNKGIIFAFEGLDGSGKKTQTLLLERRLRDNGIKALRVEFPSYNTDYSIFVKKYLSGEFRDHIDPYVVATFFSLDRLGVYKASMADYLNQGYIILCDRYVYSNLIYQGSKIEDVHKREELFDWILKFEYDMCGLPREEVTFFMDIPIDISLEFIRQRNERDIYEGNEIFLKRCYENLNYIANKYDLFRIKCFSDNRLLSVEEINDFIYFKILSVLS